MDGFDRTEFFFSLYAVKLAWILFLWKFIPAKHLNGSFEEINSLKTLK